MGGLRTLFQVPKKCGAGSLPPSSVSMVMVPAQARDLAAAGAPLPLPPLHHLLHLHTWPGAAAAASAPGPKILPPQGGACGRLRELLLLQSRESGLHPLLPQILGSRPPIPHPLPRIWGFLKHRQNCGPRRPNGTRRETRGHGGQRLPGPRVRGARPPRRLLPPNPLEGLCHIMKI